VHWAIIFLLMLITPLTVGATTKTSFLPTGFSAKFEQKYISKLSGKEKKSYGKIAYRYPGRLRFEVIKPNRVLFITNPTDTWYYTAPYLKGEKGGLSHRSTGNGLPTQFFDSLKRGLKSNPLYTVKWSKKRVAQLTFSKKSAQRMGVAKAVLTFQGKGRHQFLQINHIRLIYIDGKRVTISLDQIRSNSKLKDQVFIFSDKNDR
jgi:outer membrane lipoprotein-sorting protein